MILIRPIMTYYRRHRLLPEQELTYMEYALTGLINEWIKLIAYGILFLLLGRFPLYSFLCLVLLPLRWVSGGLHCKTFWGCFFMSLLHISLLIYLPPLLPIPSWMLTLAIIPLAITSWRHIPYTPPFRSIRNPHSIMKLRIAFLSLITLWLILFSTNLSDSSSANNGLYTLLLHTAELHIPRKEVIS